MARLSRVGRTAARITARLAAGLALLVLLSVGAVYALTEWRMRRRFDVPAHRLAVATDSASIARGERLATIRMCVACHGPGLAGHVEIDDPLVGRLAGPNLTRGGRGAELDDLDWERAVRHGVRRDGTPLLVMPAHEHAAMSDEDLGAIVAWARSLPPAPASPPPSRAGPLVRALFLAGQVILLPAERVAHAAPHPARVVPAPTAEYGAYLAPLCTGCHGEGFGGGRIPGTPPDWKPAANLTPAGIGHYTEADFVRALRTGVRPGGAPIDRQMPWRNTARMTDVELRALYAYLRALPPREFGER
ncbi:MAG TPA: cytochrome c [Gemmatimonadales bacterium]|nr:cytochrome c [Gemmatimonadales bacterium]